MNNQPEYKDIEDEYGAIVTTDGKQTELLAPKQLEKGIEILNPSDFPDLDNADVGISIETKYREFNTPGEIIRAVFNGIGKMSKRDSVGNMQELPAAYFQTKEGVFLNGGDNLVNQLSHIPAGTPVQIKYVGKVKTSGGHNVNKFEVNILSLSNPF